MNGMSALNTCTIAPAQSDPGLEIRAHVVRKLRELFEELLSESLPRRLVELLECVVAEGTQRPAVSETTKDALVALIPNLQAFAFSLCGNHDRADDLVQETLLKAWSHLESFQEDTNLRAWLFTILRNSFISEMRKRRREVEDMDGKMAESLSVAPAQHGHLDMQDLRKAVDLLPRHQREALMLVGAAGMSYEEAAQIARCAVGTVKSRVNRARLNLASRLGWTTPTPSVLISLLRRLSRRQATAASAWISGLFTDGRRTRWDRVGLRFANTKRQGLGK
jgi:RNA polymerase sigma-70 factor (ECF subfamily)